MAAHHRGRARRQPYTPAPLWEHRREWGILLGMRKTTRVVGKEGQVVIAKPIRDSLGLAPGWISIQRLVDDHVELLISDVALVETAYVLASTYGVPRETVVDHLIAPAPKGEYHHLSVAQGTRTGSAHPLPAFRSRVIRGCAHLGGGTGCGCDDLPTRRTLSQREKYSPPNYCHQFETPFPRTSAKIGAASRNIVRKQIRSFRYCVLDLGL